MILQVNDISFEGLSNDDAVKILRETVQKPGYVFTLSFVGRVSLAAQIA